MRYQFTKMQSLGNDFVMLNGISHKIEMSAAIAKKIADRHFGIGCDQILIAEPTATNSGFQLRIFNSDGSEAGQCGNGVRCFARYLRDQGLTVEPIISVKTATRSMVLEINDNETVSVEMGRPVFEPKAIPFIAEEESILYPLEINAGTFEISAVSIGNPHAFQLVEDVDTTDVGNLGGMIESHGRFPERVNAGFMQVISRREIRLRVYERGAGETLGCGSGACAAVVSGIRMGTLDSEVIVSLPGGEATVRWNAPHESVYLIGSALKVFEGVIEI